MWWYFLIGFLVIWITTMVLFKIKRRQILFWLSSVLPFATIIVILLMLLLIVLLPIIYLILFVYSLFARSQDVVLFGKKIEID